METKDPNELIAHFMGYKYHEEYRDEYDEFHSDYWERPNGQIKDGLTFNTDWNELIPVVEKIEKDYHTAILDKRCTISNADRLFEKRGATKIESVWLSVIEFIEWYNNNKR